MSDSFGDAVYEAWRAGLNPDLVDRERLHQDSYHYPPEECVEREVRRLLRDRRDDEEEQ